MPTSDLQETVYLALGSNLADPGIQLKKALDALTVIPSTAVFAVSSFYSTPPYGPVGQPDYLNAAVGLNTSLAPDAFLNHTQRIEQEQGRQRNGERWGPRTLDIDILLFGQRTMNTKRLIVPHYDMHNRAFMLIPLLEIAPGLLLPDGRSLATMLITLDHSAIQRILSD